MDYLVISRQYFSQYIMQSLQQFRGIWQILLFHLESTYC